MTDDIQITVFPNCNFPHVAMKRHEDKLQVTYTSNNCLNKFELNVRWGVPLDEIDKQNLLSCLEDWIECRNEMLE